MRRARGDCGSGICSSSGAGESKLDRHGRSPTSQGRSSRPRYPGSHGRTGSPRRRISFGHLVCLDAKKEELAIVALLANEDPVHLAIEGEASELGITAGPGSRSLDGLEKDAADKLR
jgi:hypothetical protein